MGPPPSVGKRHRPVAGSKPNTLILPAAFVVIVLSLRLAAVVEGRVVNGAENSYVTSKEPMYNDAAANRDGDKKAGQIYGRMTVNANAPEPALLDDTEEKEVILSRERRGLTFKDFLEICGAKIAKVGRKMRELGKRFKGRLRKIFLGPFEQLERWWYFLQKGEVAAREKYPEVSNGEWLYFRNMRRAKYPLWKSRLPPGFDPDRERRSALQVGHAIARRKREDDDRGFFARLFASLAWWNDDADEEEVQSTVSSKPSTSLATTTPITTTTSTCSTTAKATKIAKSKKGRAKCGNYYRYRRLTLENLKIHQDLPWHPCRSILMEELLAGKAARLCHKERKAKPADDSMFPSDRHQLLRQERS